MEVGQQSNFVCCTMEIQLALNYNYLIYFQLNPQREHPMASAHSYSLASLFSMPEYGSLLVFFEVFVTS